MASSFPDRSPVAGTVLARRSPAKTNLRLKITGKRPDGYHELETLFIPLQSPCDHITIRLDAAPGIVVSASVPDIPGGSGNICWKAVDKYCRAAGIAPQLDIYIEKHIPVAAGLGGGSANAATVLLLLQEHYRALDDHALAELAVSIGADVPFFLHCHPAVATGVGEKFTFLDFDPRTIPLVIAAPDFPVSAAWAYKHLKTERIGQAAGMDEIVSAIRRGDWQMCAALICNDLAFELYEKFPLMDMLRLALLDAGALGAEVSGSGPSMFAIFSDHKAAAAGAKQVREAFEGKVRTFVAMAGE